MATVPPSVEEEEAASEVSVPVLSVAAELLVLPQAARLSSRAADSSREAMQVLFSYVFLLCVCFRIGGPYCRYRLTLIIVKEMGRKNKVKFYRKKCKKLSK